MTDMDLPGAKVLAPPPRHTPEQLHAAALAVCHRATDVDDARELLDMLGRRQELRS